MTRARLIFVTILLLAVPTAMAHAGDFEASFENATLRVDFFQYGDKAEQKTAIDRLIRQGEWAGPVRHLVDHSASGIYTARVSDPETGAVLYQCSFDSIFGEYRTTAPASDGVVRIYHESVLLPFPKRPVRITLGERPPGGEERALVERIVDPGDLTIAVEPPAPGVRKVDGHIAGHPHSCLDIVLVGEGYTEADTEAFAADVHRFTELMLAQEPYASHRDRINIRGVFLPSDEAGVDEPTKALWKTTSVDASFYSFGSPRYLLTENNRALRDIAAAAPYDTVAIMVNHDRYGGGGIYNRFCTFTAHGPFSGYLLMHEFGHSFGGLADEYYTSSTAYDDFYPSGVEPDAPNITALLDPEHLKWGDLVSRETELPTPWDKTAYDEADLAYQAERRELNAAIAEAARAGTDAREVDALQKAEDRHALERAAAVDAFMEASGMTGIVGAFEGGGYVSEGLYRPQIDCLMFTRGVKPLCRVCRRAVEERIRLYTGD